MSELGALFASLLEALSGTFLQQLVEFVTGFFGGGAG
jgi:hypothetical protein